jgi:hypothetical protein
MNQINSSKRNIAKLGLATIAASLFATVAIPGQAQAQDQSMDLNRYCVSRSFTKARTLRPITGPQAANANWVCQKGIRLSVIRMDDVCRTQAGIGFTPVAVDPNNAYSWVCRSKAQPVQLPVVTPPPVVEPPVVTPPPVVQPPVVTPPPVVQPPTQNPITFPLAYNYVNVRQAPASSSALVRTIPSGSVTIQCQTSGENVSFNGVASTVWDQIGPNEYVSDVFVLTGVDGFHPNLARCGGGTPPVTPPPVVTVVGVPNGTEERAAQYVEGKIAAGSMEHIGWCDYASAAAHGDRASGYYTAAAHNSAFAKAGLINADRTIPRGALVFFAPTPTNGNAGHVAISLGNGRIGTTSSRGYKNVDLPTLESWTGAYTGWAYYKTSSQLGNTSNG